MIHGRICRRQKMFRLSRQIVFTHLQSSLGYSAVSKKKMIAFQNFCKQSQKNRDLLHMVKGKIFPALNAMPGTGI